MENKKFTFEHLLFLTALVIALGIRLIGLGQTPLTEFEATWAYQAWEVSQGEDIILTGQPAYILLTGFLFTIFGSSDVLARLLPTLAGSLLVVLPYSLRERLGKAPALIFAFGLALDPGLVSLSRLAGGPILAVGFGALAGAAILNERWSLAGVFAGLLLLSGPAAVVGLLGLGITWALWSYSREKASPVPSEALRKIGIAAVVSILAIGTYFMRYPQGLAAAASAIPEYFQGWAAPSGIPFWQMLLYLVVYQPLALIFGLITIFRSKSWENNLTQFLGFWLIVAAGLSLAYPSRQGTDLVWVLLPLWALAGIEISRYLRKPEEDMILVTLAQAGVVFILMVFALVNLSYLSKMPSFSLAGQFSLSQLNMLGTQDRQYVTRTIMVIASPFLAFISAMLIGYGWSYRQAVRGVVWGLAAFLVMVMGSVGWRASHTPEQFVNEFWYPQPAAGQSRLLEGSIQEYSSWSVGEPNMGQVYFTVDSRTLAWTLREMPNAKFVTSINQVETPLMVITHLDELENPYLNALYRGQSFTIFYYRSWQEFSQVNFSKWLLYREGPAYQEPVILWVRADVFPEDSEASTGLGSGFEYGAGE